MNMVVATNMKMPTPILKVTMASDSEDDLSTAGDSDSEGTTNADETVTSFENSYGEGDHDQDADAESDDDDNANSGSVLMTNDGWADSIAKILGSNKPKNKKSLVLSRAKKHTTVKVEKEEKLAFEVIGDEVNEKPPKKETVISEPPTKKNKPSKPSLRVKPNILEKDREKLLSKIATKGVVQLFNAVRNQQKVLQKEMDRNDLSEGKKEKILKKFDKRAFLDTLMGQSKSITVDEEVVTKNEVKSEDTPKWSALRDDFMMGAKMKDWDKESVDE